MKRNEEITNLAYEIMLDISEQKSPLHISMLKASRLSLLLDMPDNVKIFQGQSEDAESMEFNVGSFANQMEAARDPNTSYGGPSKFYIPPTNRLERAQIAGGAGANARTLAMYRAQTYNFAMNVYARWQFGNIAESIFELKRKRIEPVLPEMVTDIQSRLNSIEQNLRSNNSEDWKNAVSSCRALLMDVANNLMPPESDDQKRKYINRLQTYISPLESKTKKSLMKSLLEEIKLRIEHTMDLTQGAAHHDRPIKEAAEDVVLYTYLILGEIAEVYQNKRATVIAAAQASAA